MQGPTAAVVMQPSLRYVKGSLVYLVAGATLMVPSFAHLIVFEMTAFYFMQLYGFVAMMIFGLSYLFVPAFAHSFRHSLRLAKLQFWLMNIGVLGLTTSFSGLLPYTSEVQMIVVGSLLVQAVAVYIHAFNLWRTIRGWKGSPGERLARSYTQKS